MDWQRFKDGVLSDDPAAVAEAVDSLARLGPDDDPVRGLLAAVEDKAFSAHLAPLFDALVACGVSTEALLKLGASRRPAVQIEAARVLGPHGDPAAIPLLEKRSGSKRAALREAAEASLAALRSPPPADPAPAPAPPREPTPIDAARSDLEALAAGDDSVLGDLFEFLRDREDERDEPRAPEHPRADLEVEVVEALAAFAAREEAHLVAIADVLHGLRRGRFGCSVGAEFAAKRAIDDLTGTQLISAYRAWREDHTGEATVRSGTSPVARKPAPAPSPALRKAATSVAPTPVTATHRAVSRPAAPTPTKVKPKPSPAAPSPAAPSPSAKPTQTEPGRGPLPPSDYWDRPPRRNKPWWKFW